MKKNKNSKFIWNVLFGTVLTVFTLYVVLDTFVIPRAYAVTASAFSGQHSVQEETESSAVSAETTTVPETSITEEVSEPQITATSYTDSEKSIELSTYYEYGTNIYVADIETDSVTTLLSAFAEDTYGRNITAATSEIASSNNAVLAVNGDFYGSQEKGYVIRNGVLYRDKAESGQEDLVIYKDGSIEIIYEEEISAQELVDAGAWQLLSFGPALLEDGTISVTENEEVGKAMASNPRTAIGFIDENHYVLIVADGRTQESEGLSLYELAEFMQELGVKTAYNLDGGGSSTMYFNGEVVNNPTSGHGTKERSVSDILYF